LLGQKTKGVILMTESEKILVSKMVESGKTLEAIIQLLPYDKKTAKKMIISEFPEMLGRKKTTTKELVLYAYNNITKNPYEIAELYDLNAERVKVILGSLNLNRERPSHNYKKRKKPDIYRLCEKTQNIVEALKDGYSPTKVAEMYEVSRQHVYNIKSKYYKE
jgi:DNA-directed RNA polymerase specialized sigma subunit